MKLINNNNKKIEKLQAFGKHCRGLTLKRHDVITAII